MTISINKDTKLCCSFSKDAGSTGCFIHNSAFQYLGLNYIYKSFSVSDIKSAIIAMRTLCIRGAAVSMPYKIEAVKYVDELDSSALETGCLNTLVNNDNYITGFNTDYYAMKEFISKSNKSVYILGNGGMSKATQKAINDLGFNDVTIVTRENWYTISSIQESLVINCTPVDVPVHKSNEFIDCRIGSKSGNRIGFLQASKQFEIYTGKEFPWQIFQDE